MVWHDQDPPVTDVLLDVTVPFSGGGSPAYLEIDKLTGGRYRATVGTLFEYQKLCRTGDLESLLRHARAVQSSGSFDDMVRGYPGNVHITAQDSASGWSEKPAPHLAGLFRLTV